jgi:hypothetical protein
VTGINGQPNGRQVHAGAGKLRMDSSDHGTETDVQRVESGALSEARLRWLGSLRRFRRYGRRESAPAVSANRLTSWLLTRGEAGAQRKFPATIDSRTLVLYLRRVEIQPNTCAVLDLPDLINVLIEEI